MVGLQRGPGRVGTPGDQVPRGRALSPEAQGGHWLTVLVHKGPGQGRCLEDSGLGLRQAGRALDISDPSPQPMPGRKAGAKAEK